jgi:hypothetical protein
MIGGRRNPGGVDMHRAALVLAALLLPVLGAPAGAGNEVAMPPAR